MAVRVQARALETEKELALTALSEAKEAELRRRLDDEMDSFKKAALVRHTQSPPHTAHMNTRLLDQTARRPSSHRPLGQYPKPEKTAYGPLDP